MDQQNSTEITQLLHRVGTGDASAEHHLAELTYDELRRIAQRLMQWERHNTLQPTALVNEVYLRLMHDQVPLNSPDRAYFFAAAAQAMRRILVESARRRRSQKAGGHFERRPLDDLLVSFEVNNLDLIALDDSLNKLQELSDRQHMVVQMRWFAGLTMKEIADILDISVSTVEADWRVARAFLFNQLNDST